MKNAIKTLLATISVFMLSAMLSVSAYASGFVPTGNVEKKTYITVLVIAAVVLVIFGVIGAISKKKKKK